VGGVAGRVVPGLRDRLLGDAEQAVIRENCARVRATLDWIETAVDTGKVDMGGEPSRPLRGEQAMPRASERGSATAERHADTVREVLFEARPAGPTARVHQAGAQRDRPGLVAPLRGGTA
jgi:hypothetical protein